MKYMKKVIAVCLVAAMGVAAFGCNRGEKQDDLPRETISPTDPRLTSNGLQFTYNIGVEDEDSTEAAEDATEGKETPGQATEPPIYEEVTEMVPVTDASGQEVTDAAGVVETQAQFVETREVQKPTEAEKPTEAPAAEPVYQMSRVYWMDMTQTSDFEFNGEFITYTFKIKDDAPDGLYPIEIAYTDVADWDAISYAPTCIDGEIGVNTKPSEQAEAKDGDFTFKVNSTQAKPGEEVTVSIDLANNPGFCAFIVDIKYDSNVMTVVSGSSGKDFPATVNVK